MVNTAWVINHYYEPFRRLVGLFVSLFPFFLSLSVVNRQQKNYKVIISDRTWLAQFKNETSEKSDYVWIFPRRLQSFFSD